MLRNEMRLISKLSSVHHDWLIRLVDFVGFVTASYRERNIPVRHHNANFLVAWSEGPMKRSLVNKNIWSQLGNEYLVRQRVLRNVFLY